MQTPTPGPYEALGKWVVEKGTEHAIAACVTNTSGPLRSDEEATANARLLAASWEMRVMLDRLLKEWLTYTEFESDARALLARIDETEV